MNDTPHLLVDDAVLRRNIERLADWAAGHGLHVRPHAKTHKCAEVAQRQIDCGAAGLTVATIGEAEAFADAGYADLFIAYPLWLSAEKATRLRALAVRTALRIGIDSVEGAQRLARGLAGAPAEILVEVDSGMRRTGVAPAAAGAVAAAAREAGLDVAGVFTFPGHGYGPGRARAEAARQEIDALTEAAESLRRNGIEPRVVSGGSTPTVALAVQEPAIDLRALTEIRPGVYPFNDAQQVELGSCDWSDVALVAVATVVSAHDSRIVLDAGSKVLGADRPGWTTGFGRLRDHPEARIVSLSEHHAVVEFPAQSPERLGTQPVPELGDLVHIVPNHVCSTVNLADALVAQTSGGIEHWPIIARGANH